MPVRRNPVLAREGRGYVVVVAAAAGVAQYYGGWWWALPLWVLTLFMLQFFRDPNRVVPADPLGVVCPADGRIASVDGTVDPYLQRHAKRIAIDIGLFDVHSNRSPIEGKVMESWYRRGGAGPDGAGRERNALWIQTDEGDDIVVVQIAGRVMRRILCYKQPGERIGQGERYGFIRFGSRMEVYVPVESKLMVEVGQKVKSGTDLLAVLVH